MRKRHWISAFFELVFPILLVILLEWPQYSATKGMAIPKPHSNDGWEPPTYFSDTNDLSIDQLFDSRYSRNTSILYTPNNTFTYSLMNSIKKKYSLKVNVTPMANEDQVVATLQMTRFDYDAAGLIFLSSDEKHLNYKIRIQSSILVTVAGLLFPNKLTAKPADYYDGSSEAYERSTKFTQIQIALNEAYLSFRTNNNRGDSKVSAVKTHQIAYPKYLRTSYNGQYFIQLFVNLLISY